MIINCIGGVGVGDGIGVWVLIGVEVGSGVNVGSFVLVEIGIDVFDGEGVTAFIEDRSVVGVMYCCSGVVCVEAHATRITKIQIIRTNRILDMIFPFEYACKNMSATCNVKWIINYS